MTKTRIFHLADSLKPPSHIEVQDDAGLLKQIDEYAPEVSQGIFYLTEGFRMRNPQKINEQVEIKREIIKQKKSQHSLMDFKKKDLSKTLRVKTNNLQGEGALSSMHSLSPTNHLIMHTTTSRSKYFKPSKFSTTLSKFQSQNNINSDHFLNTRRSITDNLSTRSMSFIAKHCVNDYMDTKEGERVTGGYTNEGGSKMPHYARSNNIRVPHCFLRRFSCKEKAMGSECWIIGKKKVKMPEGLMGSRLRTDHSEYTLGNEGQRYDT